LPDVTDKAGWRANVALGNVTLAAMFSANAERFSMDVATHRVAAIDVYEITPAETADSEQDCAILLLHGGAFLYGSGIGAAYMAMPLADAARIKTFSVDYRMPPDHPFPVGLDDVIDAYRWLLQRFAPEKIVVAGSSAGAGLAASFVLKARDIGLPMPAACVLATPEADLTESGDTFETNDTIDVVLPHRMPVMNALYADGHDLRDPYLSPLFGDFTKGFPATILLSGTRDLFLSNTVLMHRALLRAGVEAELHIWEAMPHGGFFGAPEDKEVLDQQARFVRKRLGLG
jgi:acetyl esterase/lipase